MKKLTTAMVTLRASRKDGGATEGEIDTLITNLGTEIGPACATCVRSFVTQPLVDAINATDLLTAPEKAQFIIDIN